MAYAKKRFDLDEVVNRPGTYVNPQTEIVIVVDDSAHIDAEVLTDDDEGEWVLVSDELPVDEAVRDELLERLQRRARRTLVDPAAMADESDDDPAEDDDFASAGFDDPAAYEDD